MKPELRLFLLSDFVVNPPPEPAVRPDAALVAGAGLAAVFLPKLIEAGIGGIATALKKAGAEETEQVSATELVTLYETDAQQRLFANTRYKSLLGVYGVFKDVDETRTSPDDWAIRALESRGLIPANADISIVFEAAILRTSDDTAFYLETRHFSVRQFIGTRHGAERVYVATLAVTTPNATAEGATIALGHVSLGRMKQEALPIRKGQPLGEFPRYRSNLMPWNRITPEASAAYDSDVKRNAAARRTYMPVTFTLTLSETADGHKFLSTLGQLLEGSKGEAAKQLSSLILPEEREKSAKKEADAAEALYAAEENALIAMREAEAAVAAAKPEQLPVLNAKLAKARRAHANAVRIREAAGLPQV